MSAMLYQAAGMLVICVIFLIVWVMGCRRNQDRILENMQTPLLLYVLCCLYPSICLSSPVVVDSFFFMVITAWCPLTDSNMYGVSCMYKLCVCV